MNFEGLTEREIGGSVKNKRNANRKYLLEKKKDCGTFSRS